MSIQNKILIKNGIIPRHTESHLYVNIRCAMQDYAELYYKMNYPEKLESIINYHKDKSMPECPHCKFLNETFCNTNERNDREYYLMTEAFLYLHGSDVCNMEFKTPFKITKEDIRLLN